jgi:mannonate dehydratase
MELGLDHMHELTDEHLLLAKQLGVPHIIPHTPDLPGGGFWAYQDLLHLRTRIEAAGLKLYGIENIPLSHYDKVLYGEAGRDEQIENVCRTITHMGRAGIRRLGYHFMLAWVWRTNRYAHGRGGATVTRFDYREAENAPLFEKGRFSDEMVWDNLTYFLKAVVPVAEQEGVMLALHPDDPPVPELAGTARILRSLEAYKRAISIVDSPSNGILFCQGTVSEMPYSPEEIYEGIRYFASRDKIAWVHLRNVDSTVPSFAETFIDNGRIDMLEALRAYYQAGFKGVFVVDHTPRIVGDTAWGHRGFCYAIGYMKALIKAVREA